MHKREVHSLSNTGRLALLSLKNSDLRIRGLKDQKTDLESTYNEQHSNLVLFPSDHSVPLTKDLVKSLKGPIHLYVPDGNWSQAQKFVKREALAHTFLQVRFDYFKRSEYFLRTNPHKERLSTLEAIAQAYRVLESDEIGDHLESLFKIMVERVLKSRSKDINKLRIAIDGTGAS